MYDASINRALRNRGKVQQRKLGAGSIAARWQDIARSEKVVPGGPNSGAKGGGGRVSCVEFVSQSVFATRQGKILSTSKETNSIELKVRRLQPLQSKAIVRYYTGAGTALQGTHYNEKHGLLEFQPAPPSAGPQYLTFQIPIHQDEKVAEAAANNNPKQLNQ